MTRSCRLSSITYLLVACICLPTLLKAEDVKVWLEPTTCTPGDVIELHAQLEDSEFAEFSLQIPKHQALYFVSQLSLPTSYNGETYVQKTVWQLQAMQPGNIELTDILATIQTGAATREQTITPQTLKVTPYKTAEDANEPLPLPDDAAPGIEKTSLVVWIIGGAVLIIVLWVIFTRKKATNTNNDNQASEPTLVDLTTALEAGQQPIDIIESVLSNTRIQLSKEARIALERAAYSKGNTTDTATLLIHLRKERSV